MRPGDLVIYQCISLRSYHGTVTRSEGSHIWVRWAGHSNDSEEHPMNLANTDTSWNPLPGQVPEWEPPK